MVNPFDGQTKLDFCTERRIEETLNFIGQLPRVALDVGDRSVVSEKFDKYIDITQTLPCDFNREFHTIHAGYKTVFCFEVIEHVMNPLFLLDNINKKMDKGGTLYLSTPVRNKYGFMFNEKEHVTEYSVRVMKTMIEYAGFKIIKSHVFKTIPMAQGYKNGAGLIRGTLRMLTTYTQLHKAVKV